MKYYPALINVDRPGDFFQELSCLCYLIEKEYFKEKHTIYISNKSKFLDVEWLFKKYKNIRFHFLDDIGIVRIKRKLNLYASISNYLKNNNNEIDFYSYKLLFSLIKKYPISNSLYKDSDEVYIYITLDLEKRKCFNQIALLRMACELIEEKTSKRIVIVNSGMTSSLAVNNNFKINKQSKIETEILNYFKKTKGYKHINLYGLAMDRKVQVVRLCDFAITTAFTGSMLPNIFRIPTISFGNHFLLDLIKIRNLVGLNEREYLISKKDTIEWKYNSIYLDRKYSVQEQLISYSIEKSAFLNGICKVIEYYFILKNTNKLIKTRMPLMLKINNDVLQGKENFLFLWEGRQKQFSYLLGTLTPDEDSILNFKKNIQTRVRFCKEQKIDYKHIVFPSKPLVKERYLLDELQVSSLYQSYYETNNVYYPLNILRKSDLDKSTFRVLDTHMTDYGSLVVMKELFADFFDIFTKSGSFFFETKVNIAGDLAKMLLADKATTVEEVKLEARKANGEKYFHREINNFAELKANGGGISLNYCQESVTQKRLLVFGDSFFLSLLHLLRPIFREIVYIRSEVFSQELVYLYKPDYVITSNTERYLSKVRSDKSSGFLFFEDFQKKYYKDEGPSDKFLTALKSFFSRSYNNSFHENYIKNEIASISNSRIGYFLSKEMYFNAKSAALDLIRYKPGKQDFIKKLDDINNNLKKAKLTLPAEAEIKKYAAQIFILNLRIDHDNITNFSNFADEYDPRLVFDCALENIIDQDFSSFQDGNKVLIVFNNSAILSYLIENNTEIVDYLSENYDSKKVLFIYRLLLASYFFKSAYIVANLLKRNLEDLNDKTNISDFLVAVYNNEASLTDEKFKELSNKCNSVVLEKAKLIKDIFYNQVILNPKFSNKKDLAFYQFIKDKTVAIVGPANTELSYGTEIDSYDIVVRLSYLGKEECRFDKEKYGHKTNISYFSAHLRNFIAEVVKLSGEIDFVCVTLPKFGPEVIEYKNIRETIKFNYCYTGNPNLIQAALMEILYCQPAKVKVFCSNLFLTDKPYNDSYPSVDMLNTVSRGQPHRGMNSITFTNHDPINNFLIMKTLYDNKVIEADHDLERVLILTDEEYMSNLQKIYG